MLTQAELVCCFRVGRERPPSSQADGQPCSVSEESRASGLNEGTGR